MCTYLRKKISFKKKKSIGDVLNILTQHLIYKQYVNDVSFFRGTDLSLEMYRHMLRSCRYRSLQMLNINLYLSKNYFRI